MIRPPNYLFVSYLSACILKLSAHSCFRKINKEENDYSSIGVAEKMVSSSPCKVVVGIPLDVEDSEELLSWAIQHLAQPNDTVIALHVLGEYVLSDQFSQNLKVLEAPALIPC